MNEKPNILVIMPDQLRRDALSCYGDPNIHTPNIDELARRGTQFQNACSTYPVCVPFRFTFMTGQYAHSRMVPSIEWRMSPAERTIADEFNEGGYETIYVGKWHLYGTTGYTSPTCNRSARKLCANRTPVPRVHQGRWSKWMAFEISNMPFDTAYFVDDDPAPCSIHGYQTDGLFDLTLDYLSKRKDDRPFLCVLSPEPPHDPYDAPKPFLQKWLDRDIVLPANFAENTRAGDVVSLLEERKRYYAMVENLDVNVGRLLEFIRCADHARNTIVVFLADHGDLCGAHGLKRKRWPYEESIGIPWIVCDLDESIPIHTLSCPTQSEDIMPTLCGLAGITPKEDLPGVDLSDVILGRGDSTTRKTAYLEFVNELRPNLAFNDETWRGVRSTRYKYTVKGNVDGSRPWQLFDLAEDPYEMTNLIAKEPYAEVAAELHRELREHIQASKDHFMLSPAYGCEGVNLWK